MKTTFNLTDFLADGANGNLNLSLRKITNGIILTISGTLSMPTEDNIQPMHTHYNDEYAYTGTSSEIYDKIEEHLQLGSLFEV